MGRESRSADLPASRREASSTWLRRRVHLYTLAVLSAFAALLGAAEGLPGSSVLGGQPSFLKVDEAFVLSTRVENGALIANWRIADGYYLYRSRTTLTPESPATIRVGTAEFPDGKHKTDEYFGDVEVYYHELQVRLPIVDGRAGARIKITYQGCADAGLCYPPQTKWFVLPASATAATTAPSAPADAPPTAAPPSSASPSSASPSSGAAAPTAALSTDPNPAAADARAMPTNSRASSESASANTSEEGALAALLADGNAFTALLLFFVAGIGLAFTPCVLPMVPILSSIVLGQGTVGQGASITRSRAFALSLAYVLGMALTYAALGVVVGLFGAEFNLQARLQSPPVLIASATVFVVLALSMFGLYELQLPSALMQRLNSASARQQGGRLSSVAIMGALTALVVSPCVSAPLVGALLYLSTTGDAVLGGFALLALGLGMGTPLLAVGVGGAGLLPRAGAWMERVKVVFGFLLLGVAVWLLERLLPGPLTLVLWAALAIAAAVYLGAFDRRSERSDAARFAQAVGVLLLVWGVLLSVGAASGASDPLRPLGRLADARADYDGAAARATPTFVDVRGLSQLQATIAAAAKAGRPVLVDLYADWCIACKVMERQVFPDVGVAAALAQFELVRVDVTANDEADREVLAQFGLFGPPSMLFFDATGRERLEFRVQGERDVAAFTQHLRRFLAES